MAEFLMKDLLKSKGLEDKFIINSSATCLYEIGNPVHYGTQKILNKLNIDCSKKRSTQALTQFPLSLSSASDAVSDALAHSPMFSNLLLRKLCVISSVVHTSEETGFVR